MLEAKVNQPTDTAKNITVTGYTLRPHSIHLFSEEGRFAVLDRDDFEEWLENQTDELQWPSFYQDEDGEHITGYSKASLDEFWSNYPQDRRLERLTQFFTLQNAV